MDAVIQQLMAGRDAKMAEIAVDREKVGIDAMNAQTNRLKAETDRIKADVDAEYKRQQLALEEMKAMRPDNPNDSPLMLKEMELNHDQAKKQIDAALDERRVAIEEARLQLDEQRLELDRFKAETEVGMRAEASMVRATGLEDR
jgi:hypothetical protein